jgi:NAD(P)-dependent dehydrogenase (short-subunit alcohol dehydrogenase family)
MTNQMDGTAGSSNDRLQHLSFLRDGGITRGASLRGSTIAKKARGHTSNFAIPVGDHGPPREMTDAYFASFAAIAADLGPVDALIYNAGKGVWGTMEEIRPEAFEEAWRINAFGAFVAAKCVIPAMKAKGAGQITFIGATASRRGGAKTAAFASAKAGQRSLAESLARAYGPFGIHVSIVIIDGVVDEPRARKQLADKPDDFFVKPEDIADTLIMLGRQRRSAWSFELEARPFGETW